MAEKYPIHFPVELKEPKSLEEVLRGLTIAGRIHQRDSLGNTPLHVAAESGNVNLVQTVLAYGSHPLARNTARKTALHLATRANVDEAVQLLLDYGSDPLIDTDVDNAVSCLQIAAELGNAAVVGKFLGFEDDFTKPYIWMSLEQAILNLHMEVISEFGRHGLSIRSWEGLPKPNGVGFLHSATSDDKFLGAVRYLLKEGISPNSISSQGATPLHYAAQRGSSAILKELLAAGATVDVHDTATGGTPLFGAVQGQNLNCVSDLLEAGADANSIVRLGNKTRTMLHIAAQFESADVVRILIKHGANPNALDEKGGRPATWAAQNGNVDTLEQLKAAGGDILAPDHQLSTPLLAASLAGKIDAVQLLIETGAPLNVQTLEGFTALIAAVQGEHIAVVELLLNKGASVDAATVYGACNHWNKDIFQLIMSHGPSPDYYRKDPNALFYAESAVVSSNYKIARELILAGVPSEMMDQTARDKLLLLACAKGDRELAQNVLDNGANPEICQKGSRMTPAHMAAESGNLELFNLLMDYKCLTHTETQYGQSVLHSAAIAGRPGMIRALRGVISSGCKDRNGATPLHWAAEKGHVEAVNELLLMESPIDSVSNAGETPLHGACKGGQLEVVQLLIQGGADPFRRDGVGRTALHHAVSANHIDVVEFLLSKSHDGIDSPNWAGFTALSLAKSPEVTELLLKHRAGFGEINAVGFSNLEIAAYQQNVTLLKALLQPGQLLENPRNFAQLWILACTAPRPQVFDFLVEQYPTALESLDRNTVVKMLSECALLPDEHRLLTLLNLLVVRREWVSQGLAWRLLLIACKSSFVKTVRLISGEIELKNCTVNGWTPLMVACQKRDRIVVESLLELGADPEVSYPATGLSIIETCLKQGRDEIAHSLGEYIRYKQWKIRAGYGANADRRGGEI
jgi:ankyrin repeat protein